MNEKLLEIVKAWGVLKAEKFGEEWTVDDEQTYQQLFGKPNKGKLVKRYVCKEYEGDQTEAIRTRETNSLEEAKKWLDIWANEQAERFHYDRRTYINYQHLYAEVTGEDPYIVIQTKTMIL